MMSLTQPPVLLPRKVYDQIVAYARAGKPEEICGILRGRGLEAYELIPGKNVAEDRINNYDIDSQTLLLQFKFEESGEEMMGVYHSHPISVAYPSATDAWSAHYPDSIYFICSLEFDDAPVIRAFRMMPYFLDLDLPALTTALPFYETRRHLFAYYQAADTPIPPVLETVSDQVSAPFYIVYYSAGTAAEAEDSRVVSLSEHPIESNESKNIDIFRAL